MARERRSTDDLRRASLAVQYELIALFSFHDLLHSTAASPDSPRSVKLASNAYLHAMLLAARSLLGFLYAHKPRANDIIAEDFFDEATHWTDRRAIPAPEMSNGELMGQISKRLAHLTWDRTETERPLWGAFAIVWNVLLGLQSFVDLVCNDRIHPALAEDLAVSLAAMRRVHDEWGGQMAPITEPIQFDDLHYFGD
jgi:hypothetical protein